MSLQPGLLLADRYQLGNRIAVGGMGEVWEATDQRLGRSIAVKVLKPELTTDPEFVDRFRTEARITASLNNPGIAAVYDYGETSSTPGGRKDTAFLVMELVAGEPLSAVLARTPRLPVNRLLDVLEQSGRALQEAHARGLVHRDIKPGNILITPAGKVKITDFGIAKVAHQVPLTRAGMVMGTAQYLAPEQASGGDAVAASDVYALGIVGYECLAGKRPFTGDSQVVVAMAQIRNEPPPLPADVPAPVANLIMRALVKDPKVRFPNGAAFADAVAVIRAGGVLPPAGATMVGRATPVGVKSGATVGAATAVQRPITGRGPAPQYRGGQPPISAPQQQPARVSTGQQALPRSAPLRSAVPATKPRTGLAVLITLIVLLLTGAVVVFTFFDLKGPLDIVTGALLLSGPLRLRPRNGLPSEQFRDLDLASSSESAHRPPGADPGGITAAGPSGPPTRPDAHHRPAPLHSVLPRGHQ